MMKNKGIIIAGIFRIISVILYIVQNIVYVDYYAEGVGGIDMKDAVELSVVYALLNLPAIAYCFYLYRKNWGKYILSIFFVLSIAFLAIGAKSMLRVDNIIEAYGAVYVCSIAGTFLRDLLFIAMLLKNVKLFSIPVGVLNLGFVILRAYEIRIDFISYYHEAYIGFINIMSGVSAFVGAVSLLVLWYAIYSKKKADDKKREEFLMETSI